MLPPSVKRAAQVISANENTTAKRIKSVFINVPPSSKVYRRVQTVLGELGGAAAAKLGDKDFQKYDWPGQSCRIAPDLERLREATKDLVTYRPGGRRGLMLCLSDGVFFVENKPDTTPAPPLPPSAIPIAATVQNITVTQLYKVFVPQPNDASKPQHRTLLDVIWVRDISANSHTVTDAILVSDILVHNGGLVAHKCYGERAQYVVSGVISAMEKSGRNGSDCISIRKHDVYPIDKFDYLTDTVLGKLRHGLEGFDFIDVKGAYGVRKESDGVVGWSSEATPELKECVSAM
jgi:hypothetical protein